MDKKIMLTSVFFVFFGVLLVHGQQLVYTPTNPNFGGDTFNYQFLLQSAQSQNSFTAPSTRNQNQLSDLERFRENLNNQLLSQISRSLFTQQFGENGTLEPGTFTFGSLVVEVFESSEGLVIDILNTGDGDQTQIVLPNTN